MTKIELLELIEGGESSGVEFKRDDISAKDLAKEIVCFLNFRGGKVLLGVDDDGSIVGITRSQVEEWVMNICRTLVKPGIIPWYEEIKMEEKIVALIKVDQGTEKPYYIERGERKIYYIRVGSTCREATKEELGRLYQESGYYYFDSTTVYKASIEDLDLDKIQAFFNEKRGIDIEKAELSINEILLNTNLAVKMDNNIYPSVAGVLLFGKFPQRHLPSANITAVRFQGIDIDNSKLMDRQDINGTLSQQIEEAQDFVTKNTKISSRVKGTLREDLKEYFPQITREIFVNALIHRNYSIVGSQIRLFIFNDRLEVRSPGKLPNTVKLEMIRKGLSRSYHRNPTIAEFMQQMGYGEKIGSGIPFVLRKTREHSGKLPEFSEINEEFMVVLFSTASLFI